MLPPEPDVIAYDENMGVLFAWQGCFEAETVEDLPATNRIAKIAIEDAHLIRRRDGHTLKGAALEQSDKIVLPDPHERKVHELKRVDLIEPPTELAEHSPLDDTQMLEVALYTALSVIDAGEIDVDDRDIVRALSKGTISVEHHDDGSVTYRAHCGRLSHFRVGQAEAATGLVDREAVLDVLDEVFQGDKRPKSFEAGYDRAVAGVKALPDEQES